jgi:hypothetical protein
VGSFLLRRETMRFAVLRLSDLRPVRSPVPIGVERYSDECRCSQEVPVSIKGRSVYCERRWSRGHVCDVAIAGGKPVAYLWLAFDGWRAIDGEDAHPLLPESAAFLHNAVTMAAWRRKSLHPNLMCTAARDLGGSGYSVFTCSPRTAMPQLGRPPAESESNSRTRWCRHTGDPGSWESAVPTTCSDTFAGAGLMGEAR